MGKVFCTGNQWFIGVWKDSKKNASAFELKRRSVLHKTSLRLRSNVKVFSSKRKDVFSAMILCV